jgi:hypothetical protein
MTLSELDTRKIFCAELTREAEHPVTGTATGVAVWFLLEYHGQWRARAEDDNDLPPAVQSHLAEHLAAVPDSRMLFIKQQEMSEEGLRFFVVRTDEVRPRLYKFNLAAHEDLTALDLTAVAAGDEAFGDQVYEEPLFLVCTNGKRDKCCAKFGMVTFKALLDTQRPEAAWQSTHIGGHRYAPNMLFMPHSVNYGLFDPHEVQPAVDAYLRGEIYDLNRYRGRTYYAPPVQAADTLLRRELNLLALDGVQLRSAVEMEEGQWHVQFDLTESGKRYEVRLLARMTEPHLVSCTDPAMKPLPRYELLAHEAV